MFDPILFFVASWIVWIGIVVFLGSKYRKLDDTIKRKFSKGAPMSDQEFENAFQNLPEKMDVIQRMAMNHFMLGHAVSKHLVLFDGQRFVIDFSSSCDESLDALTRDDDKEIDLRKYTG